ncbi:MAG: triose-phosphate isomerase [Spirochaetaceae bacterium 4572_7]|nr:MAG: triose-phosphate isomerase [Spirochaetaceae bacterium 4572_7]
MRKTFIAGNWKMNKTPSEAVAFAKELVIALKGSDTKLMIAPSMTALAQVAEVVKGSNIILGAQNMASIESGARTGETSVLMLKDLGVESVILGHSERRAIYGESDALINEKVKLALANGLEAVFCIGETLDEREAGKAESVCFSQIENGLAGITAEQMANIVIAYEPVWAIGTGKTASPEDAQAIHKAIRGKIEELYSKEVAENVIIQYGGSVKPGNVKDLMAQADIDGGLIGGASLDTESFKALANYNK